MVLSNDDWLCLTRGWVRLAAPSRIANVTRRTGAGQENFRGNFLSTSRPVEPDLPDLQPPTSPSPPAKISGIMHQCLEVLAEIETTIGHTASPRGLPFARSAYLHHLVAEIKGDVIALLEKLQDHRPVV